MELVYGLADDENLSKVGPQLKVWLLGHLLTLSFYVSLIRCGTNIQKALKVSLTTRKKRLN